MIQNRDAVVSCSSNMHDSNFRWRSTFPQPHSAFESDWKLLLRNCEQVGLATHKWTVLTIFAANLSVELCFRLEVVTGILLTSLISDPISALWDCIFVAGNLSSGGRTGTSTIAGRSNAMDEILFPRFWPCKLGLQFFGVGMSALNLFCPKAFPDIASSVFWWLEVRLKPL